MRKIVVKIFINFAFENFLYFQKLLVFYNNNNKKHQFLSINKSGLYKPCFS